MDHSFEGHPSDRRIASSAMTVGQLRAALAELPDEMLIVMASDAEGNEHRVLAAAGECLFEPDSSWSGETYNTPERLAELVAGPGGWNAEDDAAPEDAIRVVVLEPVN